MIFLFYFFKLFLTSASFNRAVPISINNIHIIYMLMGMGTRDLPELHLKKREEIDGKGAKRIQKD